jgi:hypothetical protein
MCEVKYCDKVPELTNEYIVYIDSKKITTKSDFVFEIGKQLNIPDYEKCDWNNCIFWMKNLTWIPTQKIAIIINDYDKLLPEHSGYNSRILFELKYLLFSFWEKKGMEIMEDAQYMKDIIVYCVQTYKKESAY